MANRTLAIRSRKFRLMSWPAFTASWVTMSSSAWDSMRTASTSSPPPRLPESTSPSAILWRSVPAGLERAQYLVTAWTRTTEPRHARASTELFKRAVANGDIYKANYAGWYCPNCNNYYTDAELVNGRCPQHPSITPEWLEEDNYFFALSKYTDILRKHLEEHPEFVTPSVWRARDAGSDKAGCAISRFPARSGPTSRRGASRCRAIRATSCMSGTTR